MSLPRRPASPSALSLSRIPRRRAAYRARVEPLEDRRLLTISATLSGTAATLTVGGGPVGPIAFTAIDGNLSHGALVAPAGESFADEFDFDSATEGSQRLAAAATSR